MLPHLSQLKQLLSLSSNTNCVTFGKLLNLYVRTGMILSYIDTKVYIFYLLILVIWNQDNSVTSSMMVKFAAFFS